MVSPLTPSFELMAEFSLQRYEHFLAQDVAIGFFDVSFKFADGQILHAHSFILGATSITFKTMLHKNWKTNDEPVSISTYRYDDFKNLLTFLYIGNCELSADNIKTMIDMAEFYAVKSLKLKCDKFLAEKVTDPITILTAYKMLKTYSLDESMKSAMKCIANNAEKVITSEDFLNLNEEIILDIVKCEDLDISEDLLYENVYKWAQHQCASNTEGMKTLLVNIIPHIRFSLMTLKFLHAFVVRHGNIFTHEELSRILDEATTENQNKSVISKGVYRLIFKDSNGKTAYVKFHDKDCANYLSSKAENSVYKRYNRSWEGYIGYWPMSMPELKTNCNTTDFLPNDYVAFRDIDADLNIRIYKSVQNQSGIIGKLVSSGPLDFKNGVTFTVSR